MGRFHKLSSWNQASSKSDSPFESPSADETWSRVRCQRSFFLPIHYTASYQYPLVVWLHSDGFNENQVDQVMPSISIRNFVGVGVRGNRSADANGHRYDWRDSPAGIATAHESIMDAVEEAADRFSVHADRVVLAGYQSGGTMALRIALREPKRFAGAIAIGGSMPEGAIRNPNQLRKRQMPMLWQWAENNPRYQQDSLHRDCKSAMAIGARVEIRQYPGEDEMDTVVLGDMNQWIMQNVVAPRSDPPDRWSSSPTAYSAN